MRNFFTMPTDVHPAAVFGAIAVGMVTGIGLSRTLKAQEPQKHKTPSSTSSSLSSACASPQRPKMLLQEQLARNTSFFGEEGQQRVMTAKVAIFGISSAGSHCAHMLVRSGIQNIVLVDSSDSSCLDLTTNSVARDTDINSTSRADILKKSFKKFSDASVDIIINDVPDEVWHQKVSRILNDCKPDYVIDCLCGERQMDRKLMLLRACVGKKVSTLTILTTQGKCDPTRIRLGHLCKVRSDPVAYLLQKHLIQHEITLSGEKDTSVVHKLSRAELAAFAESVEKRACGNIEAVYSSESWMPGEAKASKTGSSVMACSFGMALASKCLTDLAQKPISDPLTGRRLGTGALKVLAKQMRKKGIFKKPLEEAEGSRLVELTALAICNTGSASNVRTRLCGNGKNLEMWQHDPECEGSRANRPSWGLIPRNEIDKTNLQLQPFVAERISALNNMAAQLQKSVVYNNF